MSENEDLMEALREVVAGPVFGPADAGYAAESGGFNLAVTPRPALVVGALDVRDVEAAVRFAAERGLNVAVQSTGHGTAAGRADGALLVNTSRIREISVDAENRTARLGAGCRWGEVLTATSPFGLMPLAGSSPLVGVVGYTLGGGVSPLGRAFGFAADHVRAIELVTADGKTQRVDAGQEPDLFWALRGGDGGLGVVTALEVDLLSVPSLYAGAVFFPGEQAGTVLRAYRDWNASLPEEACTSLALLRLPPDPELPEPLRGRFVVALRFAHPYDAQEGARLLAPMRAVVEPVMDTVGDLPIDALAMIHMDPTDPMPIWEQGDLCDALPDDALDTLIATAGPEAQSAPFMIELRALGGAFARPPRHPSALDGRDAAYILMAVGLPDDPSGPALLKAMRPWLRGEALPNFRGATPVARTPETARRLVGIKTAHDPSGLFR
ncbi:FAD-binding oxidoreductase [Actinocorallia sp. B10E7]|uniref:FAD-binding oxidoreductase n=1 Tax=Actinocorallia sp. B10E7 TaxID=3153558 RepID=UPI00325F7248